MQLLLDTHYAPFFSFFHWDLNVRNKYQDGGAKKATL